MLAALGPARANASERGQTLLKRLQTDLAALLTGGELTPPERAEAGQALAVLGDFRPGVNLSPPLLKGEGLGERSLPDIRWCDIPGGEFIMGSDDGPAEEKPAHRLTLPAFQISQFPITNVQFGAFVAAGGYQQERYWPEAKKEGYWRAGQFQGRVDNEGRDRPYDFGSPFNLPNHPVVGVSWYEAVAFCRWLSEQSGRLVRLPTEAEWEKAARGTDGRKYPWGNEEETAARCNMRDTGINTTSAVGLFPSGKSPCQLFDMSGNVWEWCSTIWAEKAYPVKIQDEWAGSYLDRTNVLRVLRGGAFLDGADGVRCAARNGISPNNRNNNIGFRVVLPHNF
jgi:formylglycine-generating enzyme required for sulfatase activity